MTRNPWIRFRLPLVLAGLIAAGNAQAAPWRFIVTGDSRGSDGGVNRAILAEIASAITNERPDLVLFSGDLVTGGPATQSQFEAWTNAMAAVYAAGVPVYPVRGNHDLGTGWAKVFARDLPDNGPPGETHFTFAVRHKNALFLGLDEFINAHRVNQAWLNSQLASNTAPHVFAYGHEPAFKAYHHNSLADYPADRNAFWTSLANAGARVYFCGNDHFYDRARLDDGDGQTSNDLYQCIAAGAGAPIYSGAAYNGNNGQWTPIRQAHDEQHGYMVGEVDGLDVRLTWKHRQAPGVYATNDTFTYRAGNANNDGVLKNGP